MDRYPGAPEVEDALRWTQVVVKHLAYRTYHRSIREPSLDALLESAPDLMGRLAGAEDAASICERRELHRIRREAMDGLKPHERLALTLKAAGLSYEEIQEQTGWSYTKVDRCLKEGRKRLQDMEIA
jgi:DNA-directed RNA polymerase specialized sigma24 family protein